MYKRQDWKPGGTEQVRIMTKFVEVTQENTEELGFDWIVTPFSVCLLYTSLVAIKAEDLDSLNDESVSHGLSTGKVDCALTSLYNACLLYTSRCV